MTLPTKNPFGNGFWWSLPPKTPLEIAPHQKPFWKRFMMTPPTKNHFGNGFWWPLPPKTPLETVSNDPSHQKPFWERFLIKNPFWKRFRITSPTKHPFGNGFWWPLPPKTVLETVSDDPSHQKPFWERFLTKNRFVNGFWWPLPPKTLLETVSDDPTKFINHGSS